MEVTKEMIHGDIRREFKVLKAMPSLFCHDLRLKTFDRLTRKMLVGRKLDGLDCGEMYIRDRRDAPDIRVRIYRPEGQKEKLPVLFYFHGGGYISGCPENGHLYIEKFIQTRPCVIIAPDYRKAVEAPYPAALNDCWDTMTWAGERADSLGIREDRFMVAGHSAGGGLAAAVTLMNRDRKAWDIAFQMPLYPMIDDTQPDDPARHMITALWDSRSNRAGWDKYLATLRESGDEIPSYAAPARNRDYSDFPPTVTLVGDCEPFCWETRDYVEALRAARIPVKFKLFKGCFHAFDMVERECEIVREGRSFTLDSYAEYYDRYVIGSGRGMSGNGPEEGFLVKGNCPNRKHHYPKMN
ncbi:MAG: alpha/beta hydrolase [Spirochaetales bacterium]|nr:alpha/beta hydrolase [Spirochaetales bacterium]